MILKDRYKQADRTNKRAISNERSKISEVPLADRCVLLPNRKILGTPNEVDEFLDLNRGALRRNLILVEQDGDLAQDLERFYKGTQISVIHSKLSTFMMGFEDKISYMHADYCATVNEEAAKVLTYMRGHLSDSGAVLRFTHSRRNNYKMFHLVESKNLLDWLVKQGVISRKTSDRLYYRSLSFQTDPTLRVGIQLIAKHAMGTNTLRDPTQIDIDRESMNYNIVDCVVDKYRDTGACMQTMRFVLQPVDVDPASVIESLYTIYNALT